jgi:hypothetical protein
LPGTVADTKQSFQPKRLIQRHGWQEIDLDRVYLLQVMAFCFLSEFGSVARV